MNQLIATTRNDQYARNYLLGRNVTTGVVHLTGGAASHCGASKRNTLLGVEAARAAVNYCEKCFPNGKPATFFVTAI